MSSQSAAGGAIFAWILFLTVIAAPAVALRIARLAREHRRPAPPAAPADVATIRQGLADDLTDFADATREYRCTGCIVIDSILVPCRTHDPELWSWLEEAAQ